VPIAYTTPGSTNRLSSTSGPSPARTFTHDAAGNITADGQFTRTYNDRGRMSQAVPEEELFLNRRPDIWLQSSPAPPKAKRLLCNRGAPRYGSSSNQSVTTSRWGRTLALRNSTAFGPAASAASDNENAPVLVNDVVATAASPAA
jgi:hypothetical protein